MRKIRLGVATAAAISAALMGLTGPAAAGTRAATASGTWGKAREVPGVAALAKGGGGGVNAVSCSSPGDCGAGGYYDLPTVAGLYSAFVVNQTGGAWGKAEAVPGIAALNTGGWAEISAISCTSAGNCSAGGYYATSSKFSYEPFVVDETDGTWGAAQQITGAAALNAGVNAEILSLSCASAGNCSAGGYYTDSAGDAHPFLVDETSGTWGSAQQIAGIAGFSGTGLAGVNSVSCTSVGNCTAGGTYSDDPTATNLAFVVDETNGTWGTAQQVAGALDKASAAEVNALSCTSPGNCTAGGDYMPGGSASMLTFAVTETDGTWGTAQQIAANLPGGSNTVVTTLSCASAGNCAAAGSYAGRDRGTNAFVVSEVNGTWGTAQRVADGLNTGRKAGVLSVSCSSAGNCGAGGFYSVPKGHNGTRQAFVVGEVNGTWGSPEEVPGTASLNIGGWAQVNSVSCTAAGRCSAGGVYTTGGDGPFVASQS